MYISSSSPQISNAPLSKTNHHKRSSLPKGVTKDTLAAASGKDKQTVYPLASWLKNGFQIVARFDLQKGPLVDIFQKGRRINIKAHLHLPVKIKQKTEPETLHILTNAQRTLTDMPIDLRYEGKTLHITPRLGLKGGMPPSKEGMREGSGPSNIRSTGALAANLKTSSGGFDEDVVQLGFSCVKAFDKSSKKPKDITELAELGRSHHPDLTRAALASILKPLKELTLLDPSLLMGLARILEYADPKTLGSEDLVGILQYLQERLGKISKSDSRRSIQELSALSQLLDAMVAADVSGLNRKMIHKSLMQTLSAFAKSSNKEVASLGKSCEQALIRLPSDESKVHRALRRALHAGEGASLLAEAWGDKSIGAAIGAFKEFHKAFKPDKGKSPWYDSLQFAKLLIDQGEYKEAGRILSEISSKNSQEALTLISHKVHALSKKEQSKAKVHLDTLPPATSNLLPKPGSALIKASRSTLHWNLYELKARRLELSEEEKLYIPLEGRTDPYSRERLDLVKETKSFLQSNQQVLLLQGGSGAGKSMFLRFIERMLWEKSHEADAPIPLHIRLGGIDPQCADMAEKALQGLHFSPEQIAELKASKKFIFILDGYDEMEKGQLVNLFEHGGFKGWNGKVIIGCRSQHLANVDRWQRYFAPYSGDAPNPKGLATLYVVPFSDNQISSYLNKHLSVNPIPNWDEARFIKVIDQIKGLRDLIESPFMLHMSANVLPEIIRNDSNLENITLTRRNLYNAFAKQWFERQETKLRAANVEIPSELSLDFHRSCQEYCQDLALAMVEAHIVEVPYTSDSLFSVEAKPSPFEKFLGQSSTTSILRRAAPLTNTSLGLAFVHKSLLEHFASLGTARQLLELELTPKAPLPVSSPRRPVAKVPPKKVKKEVASRYTTFDIETTKKLARALQSQTLTESERTTLLNLASSAIESFKSHTLTASLIEELVPLASIPNSDIVRRVMEELVSPIGRDVMLDSRLGKGLGRAVALTDTKCVDPSHLLTCIEVVRKRLLSLHKTKTDEALISQILTITQLANALVDSGIVIESSKVKGLLEALGDVPTKNLQVTSHRKSLKQALLRLDTEEDRLTTWLKKGQHLHAGISSLLEGAGSYSPKKILEGLLSFREAVKMKGKKHIWYDELRAAELIIQSGDIVSFQELQLAPKEPHAQLALLQALDLGAKTTLDEMLRGAWISEIVSLASKCDADVQGHVLSLLKSYRDYDAPEVQRVLNFGTEQLSKAKTESPWLSSWNPKGVPSNELISAGKACLNWRLAELKAQALNDPIVLQNSGFYVSLNAGYHVTDSVESHFPLKEGVMRFLADTSQRTLLLLGDSGSGKSLSMKLLASELWNNHKEEDPIPLFISLTGVSRSSKTIVDDALKKAGFNPSDITKLYQNRSFVFILDGYDEMNGSENSNLISLNDLLAREDKVIITCRTQYANQIPGGYSKTFMPLNGEGKPLPQVFSEITTVPFNSNQIKQYLRQFCENTDVKWTPDLYLNYIDRIPNLRKLIQSPFLLRILTEVLPGIVEKHGADNLESLKLTRVDFYEAFVKQWFERQLDKLIRGGHGNPSPEELKGYYEFAVELATQMHIENISEVRYEPAGLGKEDTHPFAKFFGAASFEVIRARTACPLIVSKEGNTLIYSFFHRSLLEFFGSRNLFESERLTAEDLPEGGLSALAARSTTVDAGPAYEPSSAEGTLERPGKLDSIVSSPLNRRLFTEDLETLRFWVDDVHQKVGFKEKLLDVVELSKTYPEVATAASNAMTILVGAEHSFANADLRGIRVPGARLDRGHFSYTDFEGADLRGCSMHEVFIAGANCKDAHLEDTEWGEIPPLGRHVGKVKAVACHQNGMQVASADIHGCLYVWGINNITQVSKPHYELRVGGGVLSMAYSPDGSHIATGGRDKSIKIWNVRRGNEPLHNLEGHAKDVTAVAYSPDGTRIVSGSYDKTVKVWDAVHGGEPLLDLQGFKNNVRSLAYSPDGKRIAVGCEISSIQILDAENRGEPLQSLEIPLSTATTLTYSTDGTRIASGYWDKTVRIWDAIHGGQPLLTLKGHTDTVNSVIFSTDGTRVVSGSLDETIRVWDANRGGAPLKTIRDISAVSSLAFSSKYELIISGNELGQLKLWSLEKKLHLAPGTLDKKLLINGVSYNKSGNRIVYVGDHNKLLICDPMEGGKVLQSVRSNEHFYSPTFSPNGEYIATGHSGKIEIYSAQLKGEPTLSLEGHKGAVTTVRYSPDGNRIASGGTDKTVKIWDAINGGSALFTLEGHSDTVHCLAFSPDGRQIASGSVDKTAKIWDAINGGSTPMTIDGHKNWVLGLAYSPDGKRIATASNDGTLKVWNANNGGDPLLTFEEDRNYPSSLSFSPNGKYIATGNKDLSISVWDAEKGSAPLINLQGHAFHTNRDRLHIAYSPDGRYIVSGGWGQKVHLWKIWHDGKSGTLKGYLVWRPDANLVANRMNIDGAWLSKETEAFLHRKGALGFPKYESAGQLGMMFMEEKDSSKGEDMIQTLFSKKKATTYEPLGASPDIDHEEFAMESIIEDTSPQQNDRGCCNIL